MDFISKNKNNTVIPLIWLLIYFSIIPIQLSNYVLCIGADGHVEFEIGTNGRCSDAHDSYERHTETVIAPAALGENHCGSCVDLAIFVPLNTEFYLVPVQNALTLTPTFVAAFMPYQASTPTILTQIPLLNIPSVVDPTLISLRNTTLLI